MRVALIVPGGVDRSGRDRIIPVILRLLQQLTARNVVHVYTFQQYPEPCDYELCGAHVWNLGEGIGLTGIRRWWWRWSRLLAALREQGPFDVLHSFLGAPEGCFVALAGRRLHLPTLVGLGGGELCRLPDIHYGSQLTMSGRGQVWIATRLATGLVVGSHYMAELARRHGLEPAVIPLGLPLAEIAQAPVSLPDGPPWRLLHVASLNRVKDQATLLQALALLRRDGWQVELEIVGGDTLHGRTQSWAQEHGVADQVRFVGWLPPEELASRFRQSHLFVLPSRHDAAPVAVLEAAAVGLPTVGTRVGFVADWEPELAVGTPIGDSRKLADAIAQVLTSREHRLRMGQRALEWAREHSLEWGVAQLETLYERLCQDRHALARKDPQ